MVDTILSSTMLSRIMIAFTPESKAYEVCALTPVISPNIYRAHSGRGIVFSSSACCRTIDIFFTEASTSLCVALPETFFSSEAPSCIVLPETFSPVKPLRVLYYQRHFLQ
ncbi:hypothetical protein BgiBS90_024604 [Biomphalaria glabrata]|nr:hypothetical protein BgiBS90_024604 [Biomphalaria glabrata]